MMEATVKNERVARRIINILAEEKCTVEDALIVLNWLQTRAVFRNATVQEVKKQLFITHEREEKIEDQKCYVVD